MSEKTKDLKISNTNYFTHWFNLASNELCSWSTASYPDFLLRKQGCLPSSLHPYCGCLRVANHDAIFSKLPYKNFC